MSHTTTSIAVSLPPDCAGSLSVLGFTDELRKSIASKPDKVYVDGQEVHRLGSVMIGTLAHFQKEIASWGGQLVLRGFTMMARQPFEIARLTGSFTWQD